MPGASQTELDDVDAFLREPKTLAGPLPLWSTSTYHGELQTTWLIRDSLGIQSGALRFTCLASRQHPSITVTFRDKLIWRLDIVDATECKPNPHGARLVGLPATICGSHEHGWHDNRGYVEAVGFGRLPFRRALQPQVRRLGQALLALADSINLTLDEDQRGFDVPHAADLFGMQ